MSKLLSILKWLKDNSLLLAAITIFFISGKVYKTVQTLEKQIEQTIKKEYYEEDKNEQKEQTKEIKEQLISINLKIDNQSECFNLRLDRLYELMYKNKELAINRGK